MPGLPNRDFLPALIDIDRDGEFVGDDVDRYSALVDLGGEFSEVAIKLPTIDNATVAVYAQQDGAIATVPVPVHVRKADNTTGVVFISEGTGGITVTLPLGNVRYIRLYTGANQTADRTILVKGVF